MQRNDSTQTLFIKGADKSKKCSGALYTVYHDGFFIATTSKDLYGTLVRDSVVRAQQEGRHEKIGDMDDAGFTMLSDLSMKYLLGQKAWIDKAESSKGSSIKKLVTGDFTSYEAVLPTKFTNGMLFSSGEAYVDGKLVDGDATMIFAEDNNRRKMLGFVDSVASHHLEKYGANKFACMKGMPTLQVEASFGNSKAALPYNGAYDNRTKISMAKRMVYLGMKRANELELESITPSIVMEKEYK